MYAVALGDGEDLTTRQRTVTCDRRNRQPSEHDHEENSTDPVRHSQMLVTRRLRWSATSAVRPASPDGDHQCEEHHDHHDEYGLRTAGGLV